MDTLILTVSITTEENNQNLHITDNHNNSCDYGDSNYEDGMTIESVSACVEEFLGSYHRKKFNN